MAARRPIKHKNELMHGGRKCRPPRTFETIRMLEHIIVTGANGQLGTELTLELRKRYGATNVIATDIRQPAVTDPDFRLLDVMERQALRSLVAETRATAIYHLAAFLSASGEQHPLQAWDLN